jgi:DNA-binding MarR family transcriptional regulator
MPSPNPVRLPAASVPGVRYGVLDELLGYPVRRAQLLVYEDFMRALAEWNMTPTRFSALVIVANNPGLKLTELSSILAIARSGAVLLTDALVDSKLVERRELPTDRRAWGLHLTAQGKKTLQHVTAAVREHDARISSPLTEEERRTLAALLRKMAGMSGQ